MPTCTLDWYKLLDNQIGIIVNSPPLGNQLCRLALSQLTRWGFYILLKGSAKMIEKKCTKCNEAKPVKEFYKQRDKKDSLNSQCKECIRESRKTERVKKSRDRYNTSIKAKTTAKKYNRSEKRKATSRQYTKDNPEKRKAMNAVGHEIRHDRIPRANTRICVDCGQQAQNFHHESYAKKDWLNVIPLCVGCHRKRHRDN